MGLTKLALTCAVLTMGQAQPGVVYTNLRTGHMQRDINDPQIISQIRELQLFMSQDRGLTWNQVDKIAPDKGGFTYNTPTDGEFWFHVVVVNNQGKQEPSDLYKTAPTMKLVVDTKPPDVKIVSAERQGDELVVTWAVHEDNPDPPQLKLEYRLGDSANWTPIQLTPAPQGKATARLNSAAPVEVRLQFKDLANNPGSSEAQVAGVAGTAPTTNIPAVAPKTVESPPTTAAPLTANASPPPMPPSGTMSVTPPSGPPSTLNVASTPQVLGPPPGSPPSQAALAKVPPIASTSDSSQGSPVPAAHSVPARPMPETQIVNDAEIALEYEVSRVGPSGIGKVEVWLTRDRGTTWTRFAEDPDAQLATSGSKYMRTLSLPGEGVFGISLVVKSKAGMGKPGPKPGDVPEMLVEVDCTPPQAKLLPLTPDTQQRDTVVLSWTAQDNRIAAKPITLEWSERPTGPWQPIGIDLPNTGRFAWQLPRNLPPNVFLKLTVRDEAGNLAVAVTREAQLVDLSEPEGRLLRVIPAKK